METTEEIATFIELRGGSLVVLSEAGAPAGSAVPVGAAQCIVGRGDHCQLVLDDKCVSTSHCQLAGTDKGVLVTDLGSRNGTYVNDVRLEANHSAYLTTDVRIRLGGTSLLFRTAGTEKVPLLATAAFGPLVGGSVVMRRLYGQLLKIASHELSVLVAGETGTGKELVAQAIHGASKRKARPLVVVDCTTIVPALAESKLFGHEKGAFTGAVARQTSPFEDAHEGTIFFDELGELPSEIQPKLLRAIDARQIQSVGSNAYKPIDVRIVSATRRNLHVEMNAKRFRDDLYYRLAQVVVEVPPLRARLEDIPGLVARFFVEQSDPEAIDRVVPSSMDRLMDHHWPGNVRELRNRVIVAHAQSDGGPIDLAEGLAGRAASFDLSDRLSPLPPFPVLKQETLDALERAYFTKLQAENGSTLSEMARRSGLSRPMVREYLHRHGLRTKD